MDVFWVWKVWHGPENWSLQIMPKTGLTTNLFYQLCKNHQSRNSMDEKYKTTSYVKESPKCKEISVAIATHICRHKPSDHGRETRVSSVGVNTSCVSLSGYKMMYISIQFEIMVLAHSPINRFVLPPQVLDTCQRTFVIIYRFHRIVI